MIEINLLPPKKRSGMTELLLPLILLIGGVGLSIFVAVGYMQSLDSAEASRQQLASTEQKQTELQQELQTLGQGTGLRGNAGDLIELLKQLRPDLKSMLSILESPLPSSSKLDTVKLDGNGGLVWTCYFDSLSEAGAYSVSIQQEAGSDYVFIQSVKAEKKLFKGYFQLARAHRIVKAGDAG